MRYIHPSNEDSYAMARAMLERYKENPEDTGWVWDCSFEEYHAFLYMGFGRDDLYHTTEAEWRTLYDLCELAEDKWVRKQPWPTHASTEQFSDGRLNPHLGVVEHINERAQEAYVHWYRGLEFGSLLGGGNFWPKKVIIWNQPSQELLEKYEVK